MTWAWCITSIDLRELGNTLKIAGWKGVDTDEHDPNSSECPHCFCGALESSPCLDKSGSERELRCFCVEAVRGLLYLTYPSIVQGVTFFTCSLSDNCMQKGPWQIF